MSRRSKTSALGIHAAVEQWMSGALRGDMALNVVTPPGQAVFGRFPGWLGVDVLRALSSMGIDAPYAHQTAAWEILKTGDDLMVATPTASGKTLCYNVPVLNSLAEDPSARALYVFPTKALARDQESSIRRLIALSGIAAKAVVYDGDTPLGMRQAARREAQIIITNPDMLHMGILPHHTAWSGFFSGLRYVVIDELHQYRGVFGSHVANVLRRLLRICGFHGSAPTFAACSATIGNPVELAKAVLGRAVKLVRKSGAPTGHRTFLLYNPEVVDPVMGVRRSALKVAARMAGDLVQSGVVTLVFCQTRRGVEIVLKYLRDRLRRDGLNPDRVRGYRGGYLPTLRREIETALRDGEVDAVISTNALELGIDVGELDAVVLAGYPGTIAATHQRAGRAGRRAGPSLAVMVAGAAPLDQFLAREPEFLTGASPERALVQPDNLDILLNHLDCATFELPFNVGDSFGALTAAETEASLQCLADEGDLTRTGDRFSFIGSSYPAANCSIRNMGQKRVVAINVETMEPIAEVDERAARRELHKDAVYQHEGAIYHVESLDLVAGKAAVRAIEPTYFTTAQEQVQLLVLEDREGRSIPGGDTRFGDVRVSEQVVGFKKIRFKNNENLGYGQVNQSPVTMETEAIWLTLHRKLTQRWRRDDILIGLKGLGHALHQVASLRLMCDPRDMATSVQILLLDEAEKETAADPAPTLFLYDAHPGGVGLSEKAYEDIEIIMKDVLYLVRGCLCEQGCPACVGPATKDGPPIKQLAVALAEAMFVNNFAIKA